MATTMDIDVDVHPDIHALFWHYNTLYFDDALQNCKVSWSSESSRNTRCAGTCYYLENGGCEIIVSEALKLYNADNLKNVLLHEMIHAFLYVLAGNKNHGYHGRDFICKMNKINSGEDEDPVKPTNGYNVTIHHKLQNITTSSRVDHQMGESSIHMNQRDAERNSSYSKRSVLMDHGQSSGGSFGRHRLAMQDHDKQTKITESSAAKDNIIGVSGGEMRYHDTHTKMTESSAAKDNIIGVSDGKHDNANIMAGASRLAPEICRTRRSSPSENKRKCRYNEERKECKRYKKQLNVTSSSYQEEEEEEEEPEEYIPPLINKRTERRKREKLSQELGGQLPDGNDQ